MPEEIDLIVGGGRRVDGRCVIPIVRALAVHRREGGVVSLSPVALLVAEGDDEYLVLLPGAPPKTRETVGMLRDDIDREKEKCPG